MLLPIASLFMLKFVFSVKEVSRVTSPRDMYYSTFNRVIKFSICSSLFISKSQASIPTINPSDSMFSMETVEDTAKFIRNHCKTMYANVKSSGKLLYRGENIFKDNKIPGLLCTPSDLLSPSAYENPVTADFFKYVNLALHQNNQSTVFPDEAHIASPDPMIASQWGPVCSIWPLDSMHYSWVRSGNLWWDDEWQTFQGTRGPLFWKNPEYLHRFLTEEVYTDKYLEAALLRDADVMFQSRLSDMDIDSVVSDLLSIEEKSLKNDRSSGSSSSNKAHNSDPQSGKVSDGRNRSQQIKDILKGANTLLYVAVPIALEAKLLSALNLELRADKVPVLLGRKSMDVEGDTRSLESRNYY